MATTLYAYGPGTYNLDKLDAEIKAASPPLPSYHSISGTGAASAGAPYTNIQIAFDNPLLPADKSRLDAIVSAHDGRARRLRPLWSIRSDVQALTTTQWNNVWADLSAVVPGGPSKKYLTSYGTNAGTIFVYDHVIYVVGGTTAQVKAGQISLTACFCQDNPSYLWHPPFDQSIAIDGTEPVP